MNNAPPPDASAAVSQPIQITVANLGPSVQVTLLGCSVSQPSMYADGTTQTVQASPNCTITVSLPIVGTTRYEGPSGVGSIPVSTCSSGACQTFSTTIYWQLQTTFVFTPGAPTTWDAAFPVSVTGTVTGNSGQVGCTALTTVGGGFTTCMAWFDFGTQVHAPSILPVSLSEQWVQTSGSSFAVGNQYSTANYVYTDQYLVSFAVTPLGAGTTSPSGTGIWENFGTAVALSASPNTGYNFHSWNSSTVSIQIASGTSADTTAAIGGVGTITATFTPIQKGAAGTVYTMTVSTDKSSYNGSAEIQASGGITPIPTGSIDVAYTVKNPVGMVTTVGTAPVSLSTGLFSFNFPAQVCVQVSCPSTWIAGIYSLNVTWAGGPATASTAFTYVPLAYTLTLSTNQPFYAGAGNVDVSGALSPVPPPNSDVTIIVSNPIQATVARIQVPVNGPNGAFSVSVPIDQSWIAGNYTVVAVFEEATTLQLGEVATTHFFYGSNVINTSTFTIATAASQSVLGGFSGVQVGYTNNYLKPIAGFVWVVVKNSAGQTAGVFVGSITVNQATTISVFVPTFNLPSGSYVANIFATTTSFVAISVSTSSTLVVN